MKKMKIIFENPETRNRDSIILDDHFKIQEGYDLTEFTVWKSDYDSAKATEMVMIPRYGKVHRSAIKGFVTFNERKEGRDEWKKTRFDTNPPSKEEWKAIMTAVMSKFTGMVGTPIIVRGVAMSLWNLNNSKTKKTIEAGRKILEERIIAVE